MGCYTKIKNVLTTWNKESKGIIYNIFDLWEMEL